MSLSVFGITSRQNIELKDTLNQLVLIDIYKTFHPKTAK